MIFQNLAAKSKYFKKNNLRTNLKKHFRYFISKNFKIGSFQYD